MATSTYGDLHPGYEKGRNDVEESSSAQEGQNSSLTM